MPVTRLELIAADGRTLYFRLRRASPIRMDSAHGVMTMEPSLLTQLESVLAGDYEVLRELGGGGMSRVFVAREIRLDREVVVKVLPPDLAAGIKIERFEREIRFAARLQHPHIVPVLTAGSREGLLYYTMPFVHGPSLSARLNESQPLPMAEAVAILRDVADALTYAHGEGVVHRDVKPQNILLQGHHAVVLDFGVAKALTEAAGDATLTSTGLALGTPTYMAPEQALADPDVDGRADIYALGVVAYEILTRQTPFKGASPQAVMAAHVTAVPRPVEQLDQSIPPELAAIVMRCLEKNPADRWQSAGELCDALNEFSTSVATSRKSSPTPRAALTERVETHEANRPQRVPFRLALVGLLIVVAIATGGFFYWRRGSPINDGRDSLAVLPFNNASGKDLAFFTDGMTEEVITSLVNVNGLRVTSPASSFALKDRESNARVIGKNLGVDYVLEGVVRRVGNRLRINARLVNVSKGSYAWSNSYDRDLNDVFDLQASISRDIASALALRLAPRDEQRSQNQNSTNLAAYDYFLKGNAAARGFTEDSLKLAISYYDSALKIDPDYARAYSGIASVYYNLADDFWPPRAAYPLVRENALKALSLDSTLADPHALLASYELAYGWNWEAARKNAERAVMLNPNSSYAHIVLAWYYVIIGRAKDAAKEAQTVAVLDPYSFVLGGNVVTLMRAADRQDLSIAEARRMLQADVGPPTTLRAWITWDLLNAGKTEEARAQLDSALAIDSTCCRRTRALFYAHTGKIEEGRRLLDSIVSGRRSQNAYYRADWIAEVNAALGDREATFASLEQAWKDRSLGLPLLAHNPELSRYADDQRFVQLKRRLSLP